MIEPNLPLGDSWVVPLRESGARPPLFCACAGDGDGFQYRHFAAELPSDQPVYAFRLPPPDEETQFPSIEQLAAIYLRKVREFQARGPYQFCGHSAGGLVAYEMAAQLAEEGEEIGLLALIDTLHPKFSKNLSARQKIEFYLTYYFDRFAKYGRNLLKLRIDKIAYDVSELAFDRAKKLFWQIARVHFKKQGGRVPESIRSSTFVLVAAWHRYNPKNYRGRLLLLNALERGSEYSKDPTLGWRRCATGGVAAHIVQGDHNSIMQPPYVRSLVERLSPYLVTATNSEPKSWAAIGS